MPFVGPGEGPGLITEQLAVQQRVDKVKAPILCLVGPPGVGKSFGVETIIEKACLFDQVAGKRLRAEVVKGSATALGLSK